MDLLQEGRELEQLAEYHKLRATLRSLSRGSIAFGLINLAIGLFYLQFHWINLLLVGIGLFMLAEGTWFSWRPSAEGVLVDGVTLLVLGLWNLAIVGLQLLVGRTPSLWIIAFGVICLAYSVRRFADYPRARELFGRGYTEEELAQADELLGYVTKTSPKGASDIITFTATSPGPPREWRAFLARGAALFVDMLTRRVLVARPDEVTIEPADEKAVADTFKATCTVREQAWRGRISSAAFAKYQAWKLDESAAEPAPEAGAGPDVPPDAIQPGGHDFHA